MFFTDCDDAFLGYYYLYTSCYYYYFKCVHS